MMLNLNQDYHTRTMHQMCAVGQALRQRANYQAGCIQSAAWIREGVTPLERSNMLEMAQQASAPGYSEAWAAWREHYASCLVCQGALRP